MVFEEFSENEDTKKEVQLNHYICAECGREFMKKNSLRRHIVLVHQQALHYVCFECRKTFRRKDILKRHIDVVHNQHLRHICPMCGSKYKTKFALKRHIMTKYPIKLPFKCETCNAQFRLRSYLNRHVKDRHPDLNSFKCTECYHSTFKLKIELDRHVKRMHSKDTKMNPSKRLICVICRKAFCRKSFLLFHYEDSHKIALNTESIQFASIDIFYKWKNDIEKESICQFIKARRDKMKHCTLLVFSCHRSGVYVPRSEEHIRRLKVQGSKKLNGFCPAEMTVRENSADGVCVVTFMKTHIGHAVADEAELAHVYLSKGERVSIANKIAAGMSIEEIKNWVSVNGEADNLRLLDSRDLHNIAASYNLKVPRRRLATSTNRRKSAFEDIQQLLSEFADSILYYKKKGELDDALPYSFKKEDVILILMTETQRIALQKFGQKVIALDGTCDSENNNFLLLTLLVINDYLEGVACAFAVSSRYDAEIIDVFLHCVRESSGKNFRPDCLMTDMREEYYESWLKVMSPPKCRLSCDWHLRHTWKRNLQMISNKGKYWLIKQKLEDLSIEPDEYKFNKKIEAFFELEDEHTNRFFEYFRNNCVQNVRLWAQCYRLKTDNKAHIYMESFYGILKHLHSECKKVGDLIDGLRMLFRYIKKKESLLKIREIRGRISSKLKNLRRRHDLISQNYENVIQCVEKSGMDDHWLVFSCTPVDVDNEKGVVQIFYVRCVSESSCPISVDCKLVCEKCQVCAHQYKCSCSDWAVKHNMCEHIHAVCLHIKRHSPIGAERLPPPVSANDSMFSPKSRSVSNCAAIGIGISPPSELYSNVISRSDCILSRDFAMNFKSLNQKSTGLNDDFGVSTSVDADEFVTENAKFPATFVSSSPILDIVSRENDLGIIKELVIPTFPSPPISDDDLIQTYSFLETNTEI